MNSSIRRQVTEGDSVRLAAHVWEASGFLVGPTVFKTDETALGRLAGSIPVRLRQLANRSTDGDHRLA